MQNKPIPTATFEITFSARVINDESFEHVAKQTTCTRGLTSKLFQPSLRACAVQCAVPTPMVVYGRGGTNGCKTTSCQCYCVKSSEIKEGKCAEKSDVNFDIWRLKRKHLSEFFQPP